jgi:hypothetical protein
MGTQRPRKLASNKAARAQGNASVYLYLHRKRDAGPGDASEQGKRVASFLERRGAHWTGRIIDDCDEYALPARQFASLQHIIAACRYAGIGPASGPALDTERRHYGADRFGIIACGSSTLSARHKPSKLRARFISDCAKLNRKAELWQRLLRICFGNVAYNPPALGPLGVFGWQYGNAVYNRLSQDYPQLGAAYNALRGFLRLAQDAKRNGDATAPVALWTRKELLLHRWITGEIRKLEGEGIAEQAIPAKLPAPFDADRILSLSVRGVDYSRAQHSSAMQALFARE